MLTEKYLKEIYDERQENRIYHLEEIEHHMKMMLDSLEMYKSHFEAAERHIAELKEAVNEIA